MAPRALIELLSSLPSDLIEEISPRSASLHANIKVPMVLMSLSAGLLTAINLVFAKCFGEIIKAQEFAWAPIFASSCFVLGTLGCFLMIYVLNLAMRYYNNLDVIPIFQSFILLCMLLSGWIVFDEAQYYSWL